MWLLSFLTLALDGRRVVNFTPRPLYPRQETWYNSEGVCVGLTAGLNSLREEKISLVLSGFESQIKWNVLGVCSGSVNRV